MCQCVSNVEEIEVVKEILKAKGLTPTRVSVVQMGFDYSNGGLNTKTYSDVEIETKERLRTMRMSLIHSYCPFCGEKYA